MVAGNNEFQKPVDRVKDSGDRSNEHFQKEMQGRDTATSYDAAKAGFFKATGIGSMDERQHLLSLNGNPQEFYEKTATLAAQSPEGIKATIAKNDSVAEVTRNYMQCISSKIDNVLKQQQVQEEFERANRYV